MDNQDGYGPMFYFMLALGIIGLLGFVLVAAGGAGHYEDTCSHYLWHASSSPTTSPPKSTS